MKTDYQHSVEQSCRDKLDIILDTQLPDYAKDYFVGTAHVTQPRTQVSYAYDLINFYKYINTHVSELKDKEIKDITLSDIDRYITKRTIEQYVYHIKGHGRTVKGVVQTSTEATIARKLSCVKSFLRYYFGDGRLSKNVAETVPAPKTPDQPIKFLSPDEVAILLDGIENGYLTLPEGQQRRYLEKTRVRDLAIITLFLGTGMRLSELTGIDINHINFNENSIEIHRKGNRDEIIYFGTEARNALLAYVDGPRTASALSANEKDQNALFFSTRNTRLSARAIEEMVTKYLQKYVPHKHLTTHKLRSTFGSNAYRETGDIYLVADAMGHKSVEVTRKHYAAQNEENRRKIANTVVLRETKE